MNTRDLSSTYETCIFLLSIDLQVNKVNKSP